MRLRHVVPLFLCAQGKGVEGRSRLHAMAALMQAKLPQLSDRYTFQHTARQVRSDGLDEDLSELLQRGMLQALPSENGVDALLATPAGTAFVRRVIADPRLDMHQLKGALEVAAEVERSSSAKPLREVVAEASSLAG